MNDIKYASFKTVVLTSIDEIIKHKEIINEKLLNQKSFYPTADFDFYINRILFRENIVNPYCILLYQENLIKAIILGYIKKKQNAIQIKNKKLFQRSINTLIIVAGGLYIESKAGVIKYFYEYLYNRMKQDFDVIQIDSFSVNYPLLKLYSSKYFKNILLNNKTQCQANVSDSYDTFYHKRSSKTRAHLRKWEKILLKNFDNKKTCVKIYNDINDLSTIVNDIETIASKTYQRKISVGFNNDYETKSLYERMLLRNKLYAMIVYIEDNPCAFNTGVVFNDTFYGLTKGYDPEYAKFSIGHFLFIYTIKYLCSVEHIKYYDFGIGDSFYKNQVTDRKLPVFQARLFARNANGLISFSIIKINELIKKAIINFG